MSAIQNLSANLAQGNTPNTNTGLTDQQVMDSSNEVASRAAAMLGGEWQDGQMKESGGATGGKFIQSSAQAVSDRKSEEAKNAAANKLTGGGQGGGQPQGGGGGQFQNLQNIRYNQGQEHMENMSQEYKMGLESLKMTYDANLAAQDHHYGRLFQELESNFEQNLSIAEHNAQALNPYSQSAGAQTAANFTGKITQDYQKQAMNLQRQADLARQELAAGHYEAYVNLHNNMQESQRSFQNDMMNFMFQTTQQIEQQRQFEVQETRANVNNYVDMLANQPVPGEEELSQMTDQQLMSLPVVQQGLRAGYDIQGIREDMLGAASMQAAEAEQVQFDRDMEMTKLGMDQQRLEADLAHRNAQIRNINDQILNRASSEEEQQRVFLSEPPSFDEWVNSPAGQFALSEEEERRGMSLAEDGQREMYDRLVSKGIDVPNAAISSIISMGPSSEHGFEREMDFAKELIARGDVEGLQNRVTTLALQSVGDVTRRQIMGRYSSIEALEDIQSSLNAYKERGGSTGRLSTLIQRSVQDMGRTIDPELTDIENRIKLAVLNFRDTAEGTRFSTPELERYDDIFPKITQSYTFNETDINSLLDVMRNANESVLKAQIGVDNYETLFGFEEREPAGSLEGYTLETLNGEPVWVSN